MSKPRFRMPTADFTAEDAQRVLDDLQTGAIGRGVVRFRRIGGAFFLTDERPPEPVEETASEKPVAG